MLRTEGGGGGRDSTVPVTSANTPGLQRPCSAQGRGVQDSAYGNGPSDPKMTDCLGAGNQGVGTNKTPPRLPHAGSLSKRHLHLHVNVVILWKLPRSGLLKSLA